MTLLTALSLGFLAVALLIALLLGLSALLRIADALEAQTRLHTSWCESQETPFS